MNKIKIISIFWLLIIWCSSNCQNPSNYKYLNKNKSDSAYSFFKLKDNGVFLKSVSYTNEHFSVYPNSYSFIVKKTKTEDFDYQVDGSSPNIKVEMFNVSNDSIYLYKQFEAKEDNLEIQKGNRLIYKTNTYCRGSGGAYVNKLIDMEDHIPFAIYNNDKHCFKLQSDNSIRWISFYSTSHTGLSEWIYEDKGFFTTDSTRYLKAWSIVYGNEDEIFEIIDAYAPYPQKLNNVFKEIDLTGFKEKSTSSDSPNFYFLYGDNRGFKNIYLKMTFNEQIVEIPIDDRSISIDNIQINDIILRKRKIE